MVTFGKTVPKAQLRMFDTPAQKQRTPVEMRPTTPARGFSASEIVSAGMIEEWDISYRAYVAAVNRSANTDVCEKLWIAANEKWNAAHDACMDVWKE